MTTFKITYTGNDSRFKNLSTTQDANTAREKVNLPNGMTCYKEYEQEALKIFNDAYDRAFDGENYEYANAKADIALMKYLND
jgi:hypothetical protein